jgi:hypothetical protein
MDNCASQGGAEYQVICVHDCMWIYHELREACLDVTVAAWACDPPAPDAEDCSATEECLAACSEDMCDIDCLWLCREDSPDCVGTMCDAMACEVCP